LVGAAAVARLRFATAQTTRTDVLLSPARPGVSTVSGVDASLHDETESVSASRDRPSSAGSP
jgi:hypothetical protein